MAGRQMREDYIRERRRTLHPASDDGITVSECVFRSSVDDLLRLEPSGSPVPLIAIESTAKGLNDFIEGYDAAKGWSAMDPGKDDRTIRAVFKMPPNPGPSEGICESLDEIDRLLEEEGDNDA